jgi:hypothetical protein
MEDAELTPHDADLRRGAREYLWFAIAVLCVMVLAVLKTRV